MTPERRSPVKPSEVAERQAEVFPDEVIRVVNEFLLSTGGGKRVVIKQRDIVKRLVALGIKEKDIYQNHWLDFESMYRVAGWKVSFDKPGFNEQYYEPYFVFEAT